MRQSYRIVIASIALVAAILTSAIAAAGGPVRDPGTPLETLTIVEPVPAEPAPADAARHRTRRQPASPDGASVGVFVVVAPATHPAAR